MRSALLAFALILAPAVGANAPGGTAPGKEPGTPTVPSQVEGARDAAKATESTSPGENGKSTAPSQPALADKQTSADAAEEKRRQDRLLWRPRVVPEEQADSPLLTMALSSDPLSRERALEGLVASKSAELIPFAVYSLSDPDPRVREKAMFALRTMDPDQVTEAVIAVLAWGAPATLGSVDAALPSLRKVVEAGMLRCLEDPKSTPKERVAAAYGLGRIASKRALQPLVDRVWGDNTNLAIYAANAVVAIDDAGSLQALEQMTQHSDPSVRTAAYYGIARIGGPEAKNLLLTAASPRGEQDLRVRREVIRDLGLVGDASTVPFLMNLVKAKSSFTQPAINALEQITGLPRGLAAERWMEWYNETFKPMEQQRPAAPPPPLMPAQQQSPILGVPPGGLPILPPEPIDLGNNQNPANSKGTGATPKSRP